MAIRALGKRFQFSTFTCSIASTRARNHGWCVISERPITRARSSRLSSPDVLVECTGAAQFVFEAMRSTRPGGIVCLTGVSSGGRDLRVDIGALSRGMVLENDVVFGSVNANRRHYQAAANALARADPSWLERLITRRVPLERWHEAFERTAP